MLYKAKSNHSLIKGKDLSLLHLTTLSSFLESEQGLTQNITKEIKNEIQISKKNERIIDKSMNRINNRAEQLIRKYQEEKEKHEKLTFLVNHIESEIYNAKLDKSIQQKSNAETDQLEQLTTLLHSRERELQKICEKTNNSSYEMSKKLYSIRALRSERTIVSELLDKIQRELCNLEHCYKVLLIERTIEDHHCQENLEDFRKLQQSARKEMERAYNAQKGKRLQRQEEEQAKITVRQQSQHHQQAVTPYIRQSFVTNIQQESQINLHQATQQGESSKEKDRQKDKRAKIQADIQKLQRQKVVKIVLNNLGLSSPKQLPESVEALFKENEAALIHLSKLQQQIETMQTEVLQLALKKKKRDLKNQSGKKQLSLNYRQELNSLTQRIRQNRLQASQFKEIVKILYQSITESMNNPPQQCDFYNQEEQMKYYMGFLESFFEKSYLKSKTIQHSPKQANASKRLTSLLKSHLFQRNHMSIHEEQDLLDFAKKNLQKLDRSGSRGEK